MVYLIRRGGNYGWSVQEGDAPVPARAAEGPGADSSSPIVEHPHSDFRSITGGYVYHGDRLPELKGAYIYGDYDTGRVWMLRYEGDRRPQGQGHSSIGELADTQLRHRRVRPGRRRAKCTSSISPAAAFIGWSPRRREAATKPFPRKLSETGLFASTKDHAPAKGLIPYSVNAQLWSDGARRSASSPCPATRRSSSTP